MKPLNLLACLVLLLTFLMPHTGNAVLPLPMEEIQAKGAEYPPPAWQLQLGPGLVDDMRFVGSNMILVSLRKYDRDLSNLELFLVDSTKGKLIWKYPRKKHKGSYSLIAITENDLYFRIDSGKKTGLLALDIKTGKEKWFITLKSGSVQFLPVVDQGVIVAVARYKKKFNITGHSIASGKELWAKEQKIGKDFAGAPSPLIHDSALFLFHAGTKSISVKDGSDRLDLGQIIMDSNSPPVRVKNGKLYLIDSSSTLRIIDIKEGKSSVSLKLDAETPYTTIVPIGKRVYLLRGAESDYYSITAVSGDSGRLLWTHFPEDLPLSNLFEDDNNRLYYATAKTVVCLSSVTGREVFSTKATYSGQPSMIHLRMLDDKLIFIGEAAISALDPEDGELLYMNGITPIEAILSSKGLGKSLKRLERKLKGKQKKETKSWLSGFLSSQASMYQNRANMHWGKAWEYSYKVSHATDGFRDLYRMDRDMHSMLAEMNNRAAQSAMMNQMLVQSWKMGEQIANAMKIGYLMDEIRIQKLFQNSIMSLLSIAEGYEYAYRPHEEYPFDGLKVTHLSTGEEVYIPLSPSYLEYGFWNLIDFEKGMIYHHGIGLDPDTYTKSKKFKTIKFGKKQLYNSAIIARPFELPGKEYSEETIK